MKILYLHQYFKTPQMSGGTRSYEMARRLVLAGHQVTMITADTSNHHGSGGWRVSQEAGIEVHWLPVPYSNQMSYPERIRAFVRFAFKSALRAASIPADVVFATSTPLTIAIPGIAARLWLRVPMVFEVRDMWPDVPIALGILRNPILIWLARRLELFAYRQAGHVVALAPGMRDDIIAKGVSAGKVSVIPNGCDLDIVSGHNDDPSPRNEYSWLGERKLVLYAGAIGVANGVDYLVHLAHKVLQIDSEIRFVIFGEGREKESVQRLAVQLGVLERNLFIFNPLSKRKIARWWVAADMHVALMRGPRVYLKDAVNNKFFDALAAHKPIANNFDGWQSRIAEEGGVGLILNSQDVCAAARQLVNALEDSGWISKVPERARLLAEGRFSRDRLALQLEDILTTAVKKYRRNGRNIV